MIRRISKEKFKRCNINRKEVTKDEDLRYVQLCFTVWDEQYR